MSTEHHAHPHRHRPLHAALTAAVLATTISVGAGATPAEAAPAPAVPARTDTVRAEQWHLETLNLAGAWPYATGAGVTVAVIDSGVDATHADLRGQVLPGLDLVDDDGDARKDLVGHGTTVSALIAGKDDETGVIGIAPDAKILPIRVLDRENRYDDALIVAQGVRYAVDNGAQVINLSLGGSGASSALEAAIDYAFAKNVVVVACTGNASASAGEYGVWYPAREPGVLAVSGLERDGKKPWDGSITGKETVVSAPATDLVGARPGGYWRVQGTSFAAPMVAGTAALIRSRWPDMPAAEVVNRIIKTADDRGEKGRDAKYGYGLINPEKALTADVPAVTTNPLDNTPPPGRSRFGEAPTAGEAQSATSPFRRGTAPVPQPGGVTAAEPAAEKPSSGRWWPTAALLALSAIAAAVVIRRTRRAA